MSRAVASLVLLFVIASLSVAACAPSKTPVQVKSTRGLVIDVVSKSITETQSLVVRMEDGRELTFKAEGFLGFTPSHLREHGSVGEPVTVYYEETPSGLVATKVTD